MADAAAPSKTNWTPWIVLGVTLLILAGIGIVYYFNKDFLNLSGTGNSSNGSSKGGALGNQPIKDAGGIAFKK